MESVFKDGFFSCSKQELESKMNQQKYFHDIELGEYRTKSWVYPDDMPPNYHLFPMFKFLQHLEITNARAIDIGTYDGLTAFILSELGAAQVDATCQFDLERFRLVRAYRQYGNIAYYPRTDLTRISKEFDRYTYDLVCMSAMLHHLLSPLEGLMIARSLLRNFGYLIVEAAILEGSAPVLSLNTELDDAVFGAPTVWLASESAMEGMIKFAGFDIVSRTRLQGGAMAREVNYNRVTFLAQATKPSAIKNRSKKLIEIQNLPQWNNILDYEALENSGTRSATIKYLGNSDIESINIWFDYPEIPLQPAWKDSNFNRDTQFRVGTNEHFMQLMHEQKDDLWNKKDTTLLAAKCPGEVFPEGMTWSLKQYANLFCLSYIKRWGLKDILEVGAGFNLYFENHLPLDRNYTTIDDEGFYDEGLLKVAKNMRKRGKTVSALLGHFSSELPDSSFDCCISTSVLEHIPDQDILNFTKDMFRVLRPGGFAVHSIDLPAPILKITAERWQSALNDSGFLLSEDKVNLDLGWERRSGDEPFIEPISIITRFYGGFNDEPWLTKDRYQCSKRMHTVLFAVRKPYTADETLT